MMPAAATGINVGRSPAITPYEIMNSSRQSLSAKIIATLKDRVLQWEYLPGQRLTEEGLSKEFEVSRSPVREALRVLAANGFIEKKVHQGYLVKQLDAEEIKDLYELRMALEIYVVERLAVVGIREEIKQALVDHWSTAIDSGANLSNETLSTMDQSFHEALAVELGNRVLAQQLAAINERLSLFRVIDFSIEDRARSTARQHLDVLERIAAHDILGAREAITNNIQISRDNVHKTLTEALGRAYLRQRAS
ncbi:MAG: GntR family transcriptional regulator [Pseudomonadota bacterium]